MKIAILTTSVDNLTLDTPYNKALGGTESAVCYFIEEMKLRNHEIIFFTKINQEIIIKGVPHIPANLFMQYINSKKIEFDIFIVSCNVAELFQVKLTLNNPNTLYCLWTGHDIDQLASTLLDDSKSRDYIDIFIFVSNWQRERYLRKWEIPYYKTIIMRNGIGKPFEQYLDMPLYKKSKSMAYCSIPWRGLALMEPIFKEIKESHKDSQLNIYSGMNIYNTQDTTGIDYSYFKITPSVNYNEGVSQTLLAKELFNNEFLSYPNIFPETSCISVLQAMACGCLIVTSDLGALKETMGGLNYYINIDIYNFDKVSYISQFVSRMRGLLDLELDTKKKLAEYNRKYIKDNYTWNVICQKFEQDILIILLSYRKYLESDHKKFLSEMIKNFTETNMKECFNSLTQIKFYPNINEYCIVKLNAGVCNFQFGKLDIAKKCFKTCLQLKNDYNINKNIALLELQSNNLNKFIKYARQAISLEFEIELANLLAEKYEMLGLYNDAISLYETIIFLDPNNVNSFNNLGNLYLLRISQIENIDNTINDTYNKSLELCIKLNEPRKKELVLSNIIFNNLYNWKLTDKERFEKSCIWYKYFPKEPELKNISSQLNRTMNLKRKIKIGYISCDFITHPVGFMFNSILKNHNIEKFEIYCYDCCDTGKNIGDVLSKKLREYNNAKWYDICQTSDKEALSIIIKDDLDILIDMMGHTRNTRMNILQYKPARILISYFAYPATNGLNEIDYRFSDIYASPPDSQQYFIEKLYYLPNGFQCYTPPVDIESIKDYSRDKYTIHLCCFNNPTKLSIPTINMFCDILKQLPEAKLFLRYCYYKSSFYKSATLKLFTDRGIEKERIDIGFEPIVEALILYNKMDIALDPFPYNGGTISSEAIYMNTPIITLAGTTYYSRVGVSLLSNLGLEKYIAINTEDYISKVVNLARNSTELKTLHQILRFKMLNSDLANSQNFTRNIETAYIDMISKYQY